MIVIITAIVAVVVFTNIIIIIENIIVNTVIECSCYLCSYDYDCF